MEEGVKKGYPIWSLLVIMTLLAVWLAIPRRWSFSVMDQYSMMWFFLIHQVALWTLMFGLAWILLCKRRLVLYLLLCVLMVLWVPQAVFTAELQFTGTSVTWRLLESVGLAEIYSEFVTLTFLRFGYGHI